MLKYLLTVQDAGTTWIVLPPAVSYVNYRNRLTRTSGVALHYCSVCQLLLKAHILHSENITQYISMQHLNFLFLSCLNVNIFGALLIPTLCFFLYT